MRNVFAMASFVVAVLAGLGAMFLQNRDKQTMSSIVAFAFLVSFFINLTREPKLISVFTCAISFAMAVLGGVVAALSDDGSKRDVSIVIGIVSLGISLFIFFAYVT